MTPTSLKQYKHGCLTLYNNFLVFSVQVGPSEHLQRNATNLEQKNNCVIFPERFSSSIHGIDFVPKEILLKQSVRASKMTHYSFIKTTILSQLIEESQTAESMTVCYERTSETIQRKASVRFQILSLHHVNKFRVKQCSHRCHRAMVSDVDIAVDTQSNLLFAGL